ncbi:MAG: protein-tyrosine-phosphatase [Fibrobacteres bacterium]|nr:protein-tyrosine-phosphatase [Fibrobacterota bacterium]
MSGRILFVCLGNICRSPLAEGIFLHQVKARGLEGRYTADSAGTGDWHVGNPPDTRSINVARKRGVALPSLGRQVRKSDFEEFDLILAMDGNNRRDLLELSPAKYRDKVKLMRDFDAAGDRGADVPDPYYGGPFEFDNVYEMLDRCCSRLLETLEGGASKDGGRHTGDAARDAPASP